MSIKNEIKEIGRLSHIIAVLFEEGLDYLIYEVELHSLVPFFSKVKLFFRKSAVKRSFEESVLHSIQRLGGFFVKGGQILSTRPDFVGDEFAKILSKLRDKDIPFKFREVRKIIEAEFKAPLEDIFSSFDQTPVSAASLGQVHKAKLKDGTLVAVKVQRPNIEEQVEIDFKLLKWLLNHIKKKKPHLLKFHIDEFFKELKRYTFEELDYTIEANNIAKFEKMFKDEKNIIIPHVYFEYSTSKVLTMSWQEGNSITKYYGSKDGKLILKYGIKSMVRQYFEFGFFQGDPHPGNFFISEDNKLIYLDFGMIGSYDKNMKKKILRLFLNLFNADAELLTKDIISLNVGKNKVDYDNLFFLYNQLIENSKVKSSNEYTKCKLFYQMIIIAVNNGVKFPHSLLLLAKSIATLDELAIELNPNWNLEEEVKPIMLQIIIKDQGLKEFFKFKLRSLEKYVEKDFVKFSKKAEHYIERVIDKI